MRQFLPIGKYTESELAKWAALASVSDNTPEGKSIVTLYQNRYHKMISAPTGSNSIPFTAQTRMSGVDLLDGSQIRKGAAEAVINFVIKRGGRVSQELREMVEKVAKKRSDAPGDFCRQRNCRHCSA